MKVLIVGATGTLGQAVAAELGKRHDVIRAARSGADIDLDMADTNSIRHAFETLGQVDAVVSAAGTVKFADFAEMQDADYRVGLDNKLMGQVNLVLIGRDFVPDGGSFTLTTGILTHDPIRYGSSASMVNGALESFVKAAAIEIGRGHRINAVSPGMLVESVPNYGPYFPGHDPVPAAKAALGFTKSVDGLQTGQIFEIF